MPSLFRAPSYPTSKRADSAHQARPAGPEDNLELIQDLTMAIEGIDHADDTQNNELLEEIEVSTLGLAALGYVGRETREVSSVATQVKVQQITPPAIVGYNAQEGVSFSLRRWLVQTVEDEPWPGCVAESATKVDRCAQ